MSGPWRVRFVHGDDPVWQRLKDAGLVPADAGTWDLFEAAKADPGRVMAVAGGWMPWTFFAGGYDAPTEPPLGAHIICPQCGQPGAVYLRNDPRYPGARWDWNGSSDAPTLSPSILSKPPHGCGGHYWLRDGVLTDCGGHRPV